MIAKGLEVPKWVKTETEDDPNYARFIVEPFERGYGTTLGNSLRRVLLSSLEGAAIVRVKIKGCTQEFSTIKGVVEDVTEIVLNLKSVNLKLHSEDGKKVVFAAKGQRKVKAGDLFSEEDIEVLNPDCHILSMTKRASVEMEIDVTNGRGYVRAEQNRIENMPIGTLCLDALFSPVRKVNFRVEDARVGQVMDYDRLVLEVWTNGGVTPEEAVQAAAEMLVNHFNIFVRIEKQPVEKSAHERREEAELVQKLARGVNELELSVRSANCLKSAGMKTIADLVQREDADMLKFHNFGKKSLQEIKEILVAMDLSLGMELSPELLEMVEEKAQEEEEEKEEAEEEPAE